MLRWNDFNDNVGNALREMRDEKDFFDVTLACEDEQIEAHKVVLSACSPFFRAVLRRNPHNHPLLYLKGIKSSDLQSIVSFMYEGEVNVGQAELTSFLAAADELSVKGLTQMSSSQTDCTSAKPFNAATNDNMSTSSNNAAGGDTIAIIQDGQMMPTDADYLPTAMTPATTRKRKQCYRYGSGGDTSNTHTSHQQATTNPIHAVKSEMVELECGDTGQSHSNNFTHDSFSRIQNIETLDNVKKDDLKDGSDQGLKRLRSNKYTSDGHHSTSKDCAIAFSDKTRIEYNGMLEDAMKTSIRKLDQGAYNCVLCDKVCRDLTRARQHLEAKHYPSVGYTCQICEKHCKTKHALTCHVSVYHRDAPKLGV